MSVLCEELAEGTVSGVRWIVLPGPIPQVPFCAYVGIPLDSEWADREYDDVPLEVHGGLTFGGAGDGQYRPIDFYWYGWDYGHAWSGGETLESVIRDAEDAARQMASVILTPPISARKALTREQHKAELARLLQSLGISST